MITPFYGALKSENKGNLKSLLPNFGLPIGKVKSDLIFTICTLSQRLLSQIFINFGEKEGNFIKTAAT